MFRQHGERTRDPHCRISFRDMIDHVLTVSHAPPCSKGAPQGPHVGGAFPPRFQMSKSNKVLIIVGDATETVDTLYPYYRLEEGGFTPVVAGAEKRKFQMVMDEGKPGRAITKEGEGYTIDAEIAFADVNPEEYLGIFFSGGRAPEYIRENPDLMRITKWFFANNKPIASVCHGCEIPARADCIRGRRMAAVAKCRFDI